MHDRLLLTKVVLTLPLLHQTEKQSFCRHEERLKESTLGGGNNIAPVSTRNLDPCCLATAMNGGRILKSCGLLIAIKESLATVSRYGKRLMRMCLVDKYASSIRHYLANGRKRFSLKHWQKPVLPNVLLTLHLAAQYAASFWFS